MKQLSFLTFVLCVNASFAHAQAPMPHGEGDPHAGVDGAPHMERALATAEASETVPPGSIRVTVVDENDAPVANAQLNVGSMGQEGQRNRVIATTDASGMATFSGLTTGGGQAYRVNLPYEGATYSCTPFQLPTDHGYVVRIIRLPITRDARFLVQGIGLMMVELRESRLHISQQARLMNLGEATYVFPAGGINFPLPRGFVAPEAQPVMTDQRVTVTPQGFRMVGSMPPGNVVLTWTFDLPITGSDMAINQALPVRTLAYRVLSDAAPGMRLDVAGFPPPEVVESEGRNLFATQLEKPPTDPIQRLEIRLHNLPGPNPVRWVAVVVAFLTLAFALFLVSRRPKASAPLRRNPELATEKSLLDEIAALDAERRAGKVGPKFFARRRDLIATELALVLKQKASSATENKSA